MIETFQPGDILKTLVSITGHDDFFGSLLYAPQGCKLTVNKVLTPGYRYEVHLASNNSPGMGDLFWVRHDEVMLLKSVTEDTSNLVHSVVLERDYTKRNDDPWDRVAKILREYKKKKNKGFYVNVEELPKKLGYWVKVYKE
jgi:hypothetical protein